MKVTKYPQSCLLIEKDNHRIVIDPGNVFTAKYKVADLGKIDAVLYTHQHADHFDESIVGEFTEAGVKIFGNEDVTALVGEAATTVHSGEVFEVAGFNVLPHDLPHCKMVDGSDGPPNTGFIIDGTFFHAGDGTEISGVSVHDLAVPIAGPDVTMRDAADLAISVGAKRVIPMHYDNHNFFPGSPQGFATATKEWFKMPFEVIVLEDGQSVEL